MSHAAVLTDRRITGIHLSMADDSLPLGRSSRDESELIRRIREGDTERFAELIDRYQRHVGRWTRLHPGSMVDLRRPGRRDWRSQARRRQNGRVNSSTDRENLVGDKGPGSKSGGKKPKGGPKPGDKKKR